MNTPPPNEELVVLVDEHDREIGAMPKSEVHTDHTPLHRAFSAFLFDRQGNLLLQQRSKFKKTWPLVWSGSCCGHPLPGENRSDAIRRRVKDELGSEIAHLSLAIPDFIYRTERDGVVEHEFCPVWIGRLDADIHPNPDEVEAVRWMAWPDFVKKIRENPDGYASWCGWEIERLVRLLGDGPLSASV